MAFPLTNSITTLEFIQVSNNLIVTSLSGYEQRAQVDIPRWQIIANLENLDDEDRRKLQGFVSEQGGTLQSFDMPLPGGLGDSSAGYTNTLTTTTGGSVGDASITAQATVNSTLILKAGDLIKFTGKAKTYAVKADVTTNGSGVATITFSPNLLDDISTSTAIIHRNVQPTMRFNTDTISHVLDPNLYGSYQINMLEVFR
jgi:hypothetical protein